MNNRIIRILMRVTFAVSLILNAIAIGIFLQLSEMRSFFGMANTRLPAEVRREFIAAAKRDTDLRTAAERLGAERQEMIRLGLTDPIDQEALEAAMQRVRDGTVALQLRSQSILLETLKTHGNAE